MRITRLHLRNYRVYEDELDLEIPPGLVGIYGPNGAGKSYLIESIRWTLFGKSRTPNEEVRTAGVNGECVTEVEFEHEGHLYLVRRTLSGINATVRAEAWADNLQVGEGVRDVAQYVQSILGMDDAAFRSSVFAEQNQVAAFSQQTPAKRRDLVLRLLGITPLDQARDDARRDAKAAMSAYETLRTLLPDLDELTRQMTEGAALADEAAKVEQATAEILTAARAGQDLAEAKARSLDELDRTYNELVTAGKVARQAHDQAAGELARLDKELAELDGAGEELARLTPLAEGLEDVETQLRLVEAVVAAEAALAALPLADALAEPDERRRQQSQSAADEARSQLAVAEAGLKAAEEELARVDQAHRRSASLSTEHDCPLCGQELGDAFEQVQAHRAAELDDARARLERSRQVCAEAKARATRTASELDAETRTYEGARHAWAAHEESRRRRHDADEALSRARHALAAAAPESALEVESGSTDSQAMLASLRQDTQRRRQAAADGQRLRGRLDRQQLAREERERAHVRVIEAAAQRQALLDKVEALGYRRAERDAAHEALLEARRRTEAAVAGHQAAAVNAGKARADADAASRRLVEGQDQHERVRSEAERARHLGRAAELLSRFRNTVVATVGPRLAAQAADLFAELTDHEYDRLEVDAETYEIQIRDAGRLYGMDRFSGSETDLANLALRVAISEHVRFQSGGAVGLLVLDEVFGPLDDNRKERMLLALERLKGHFRQVLVVTHASEVKEQLPNAIEVVKLPGRRATARLLLTS